MPCTLFHRMQGIRNNFLFESKAFFNQYLEKQIFEEKTGMDFKLSQAILKAVINNKQRTINSIH